MTSPGTNGAGAPDGHGHERVPHRPRHCGEELREAGIRAVAISLDSKDPATHDAFRGLDGVWEKAMQAIGHCRDAGMGVQDQHVGDAVRS